MKFNRTKPCDNCPFRKSVRPFISLKRMTDILRGLLDKDQTFSCHKHNRFNDAGKAVSEPEHCAGAAIFLEKNEMPNQWMRVAERLGVYRPARYGDLDDVYRDKGEVLNAYRKAERELDAPKRKR